MSIYQTCISDFQNLEILLNQLTCNIFEYLSFGDKHPNIENIKKKLLELIGNNTKEIEIIGITTNQMVYYIKKKDIYRDIIDLYSLNQNLGTLELVGIIRAIDKSIQLLNGENI